MSTVAVANVLQITDVPTDGAGAGAAFPSRHPRVSASHRLNHIREACRTLPSQRVSVPTTATITGTFRTYGDDVAHVVA